MLILKIMDHDLHRSKDPKAVPRAVCTQVHPDSFPCIVSGSRGQFLVSSGPQKEGPGAGMAMIPVFKHDSDKMDSLIGPMLEAAFRLSKGQSYRQFRRSKKVVGGKEVDTSGDVDVKGSYANSFSGPGAAKRAFEYVQKSSGFVVQPHVCLVPSSMKEPDLVAFFGDGFDPVKRKFRDCCRVISHDVPMPVFLSRPDMVGMYTQFMAGGAALILHNVELGMAFCPASPKRKAPKPKSP